jgi:adenylylsulfate reductase subunit B
MPVNINYAKCNSCGICYDNCPLDVYEQDESLNIYKAAYQEDCWHCGVCVLDCPKDAIELTMPFGCL